MKLKSIINLLQFLFVTFFQFIFDFGVIVFTIYLFFLILIPKGINLILTIIKIAFEPIYNFLKFGTWTNTSLAELIFKKDPSIFSEWIGLRKIVFWIFDHFTINFLCSILTALIVLVIFKIVSSTVEIYTTLVDILKKIKKEIFKFSFAKIKESFKISYQNFLIQKKYIKKNINLLEKYGYINIDVNIWTNKDKQDVIKLEKEDLSKKFPKEIINKIIEKK